MNSYMHVNSAVEAPTLDAETLTLYRAVRTGSPVVLASGRAPLPEMLRTLAERLACDAAAEELRRLGVDARVTESPERLDPTVPVEEVRYVSASVSILGPERGEMSCLDAEAALRIVQRLGAGLTLRDAIDRTMEQCYRPTLSDGALRRLEREADAAQRRLLR
jgi:hypothetical protein